MGGKHPKTIITNQDKAMKTAIEQVFINTRHINCLFHIKNKCYNKNLKVFTANEGLYEDFEDTFNNSLTVEKFEELWKKMIEDKNLQQNKYFSKMWEMREKFIPVYYKNDFFPFIQTTSRSESTNSRFKDNIGPTYSVISFLKEYTWIVDNINKTDKLEDTYNNQKRPKELLFDYTIEQEAEQIYNKNIFKKYQVQLKATSRLSSKETEEGKTFEVWQKGNQIHKVHRIRKYIVNTDLTEGKEEFSCICGKINKDGLLCSHILKIIIEKDINTIPQKYYIDRWRKKNMNVHVERKEVETVATSALLRYNILSRKSAVLNSKASKNEQVMEFLMIELDKLKISVDEMLTAQHTPQQSIQQDIKEPESRATETKATQVEIDEPHSIQRKGRPPKPKRMKTLIEQVKNKMEDAEKKKTVAAEKKTMAAERKKNKKSQDTGTKGSPVKPKRKKMKETSNASTDAEATIQYEMKNKGHQEIH